MLIDEIKEYISLHLSKHHKSRYIHGSRLWSDAKWLSIIVNKFDIPKGEFRTYKSIIVKEVNKIKSIK
jgi:hypothetical protein